MTELINWFAELFGKSSNKREANDELKLLLVRRQAPVFVAISIFFVVFPCFEHFSHFLVAKSNFYKGFGCFTKAVASVVRCRVDGWHWRSTTSCANNGVITARNWQSIYDTERNIIVSS